MPKQWDRKMKRLLTEAPQDFVEWLLSGAQYIGIVSSELDGEPLYTDMLYEVLQARGGAKREVVEEAIAGLAPAGQEPKAELLVLTYGLASLALENEADQEWLDRRFSMLYDILRETRAFRELSKESRQEGIEEGRKEGIEEGRKEGIEEGIEKGLEKGKVEALREALLNMVQARFSNSKIARLAKGQAAMIDDPAVLQDLIVKVGLARTLEEAQHYLLDWPGSDNENN